MPIGQVTNSGASGASAKPEPVRVGLPEGRAGCTQNPRPGIVDCGFEPRSQSRLCDDRILRAPTSVEVRPVTTEFEIAQSWVEVSTPADPAQKSTLPWLSPQTGCPWQTAVGVHLWNVHLPVTPPLTHELSLEQV